MARFRYIDDPDALKEKLQEMVRQIHDEADPHAMNEYKRFVKQNVSVFSRAYFTAYLVKHFLDDDGKAPRRRSRPSPPTPTASPVQDGEDRRPDSDQQTLFVSVGKNRRVFPKDIIGLFTDAGEVTGDNIGQIKILDSYTFVDVDSSVADALIARFDGADFRGRKLKVNYARSKKND